MVERCLEKDAPWARAAFAAAARLLEAEAAARPDARDALMGPDRVWDLANVTDFGLVGKVYGACNPAV